MLIIVVNSSSVGTESIVLKYFEKGHTFMSADSVHHGIEQEMRKRKNIFDFNDFVDVVKVSNGGKMEVIVVEPTVTRNWVDGTSAAKLKRRNRVLLSEMSEVKVIRGSRLIFCKKNFEDTEYIECDVLREKFSLTLPETKVSGRGIPQQKKDDIVNKLCPLMPASRRSFWSDLLVNKNVNDLIDN